MLGHRGCRLGVSYPEVTSMQAHAIIGAAEAKKKEKPQSRADDSSGFKPRRVFKPKEGCS